MRTRRDLSGVLQLARRPERPEKENVMTALSIERIVHPVRRSAPAPRDRAGLTAWRTTIVASVRAARAMENAVSPAAQLRAVEQFAASISR